MKISIIKAILFFYIIYSANTKDEIKKLEVQNLQCKDAIPEELIKELQEKAYISIMVLDHYRYDIIGLIQIINFKSKNSYLFEDNNKLKKSLKYLEILEDLFDRHIFLFLHIFKIRQDLFNIDKDGVYANETKYLLPDDISGLIDSMNNQLNSLNVLEEICIFALDSIVGEFDKFISYSKFLYCFLKEKIESQINTSTKVSSIIGKIEDNFQIDIILSSPSISFDDYEKEYICNLHYFKNIFYYLSEININPISETTSSFFIYEEPLFKNFSKFIIPIYKYFSPETLVEDCDSSNSSQICLKNFQNLLLEYRSKFYESFQEKKFNLQEYAKNLNAFYKQKA